MIRAFAILLLSLMFNPLFAQQTVFFERVGQDSVKLYFDEEGELSTAGKSAFYRVGKMDNWYFSFVGEVKDYSNDNVLQFIGNYKDGKLNGPAKIYRNGKLTEQGSYKNDKRDSLWTFYARDKVEKIVDFSNDQFRLCEYYSSKGENKIINGECDYKDNIKVSKYSIIAPIKGKFKNGLIDGKWATGNNFNETYKDGKFISGFDNSFRTKYLDKSRLKLTNFCPSEYANFYFTYLSFSKKIECSDTLYFPKYNGNGSLDSTFFSVLKDSISYLYKNRKDSLYYLIELTLGKDGKISTVKSFSPMVTNKSDEISSIIKNLNKWEALRCVDEYYESTLFFPILIEKGEVTIPKYTGTHLTDFQAILNELFH